MDLTTYVSLSLFASAVSVLLSSIAVYFSMKSLNNDVVTKELVDQMAAALKRKYIF